MTPAAGAHASPGMHPKHYSPRTRVVLVRDGNLPAGRGAYLWIGSKAEAGRAVPMPPTAADYGGLLYSTLHELDSQGWDWIAIEEPPPGPEWEGILDRLRRASASDS